MTDGDILHLGFIAFLSMLTGGCAKILGVGGYSVSDGSIPLYTDDSCGRGVQYTSPSCGRCVVKYCCQQAAACASDPGCTAMAQCLAKCEPSDHACRAGCNLNVVLTSGPEAFSELVQCEATAGCESCGSALVVQGGASCDRCFSDRCAGQNLAFSKDGNAIQLAACGSGCPANPDGGVNFLQPLRGGEQHLAAVGACADNVCQSECHIDSDWSCLGTVKWPPRAASRPLTIAYQLQALGGMPLRDVEFSACDEQELDCKPKPGAKSGADGWVSLTIENPPGSPLTSDARFVNHYRAIPPDLTTYQRSLLYSAFVATPNSWSLLKFQTRALAQQGRDSLGAPVADATKGTIVTYGFPCTGFDNVGAGANQFSGVVVSIDTADKVYYLSSDQDQTGTGGGFALIFDVEPGRHTLEARVKGQLVGTLRVLVVADTITAVQMGPMPAP